jgi:peptidoglycan/LPS O-acetylase OafA/YrhL
LVLTLAPNGSAALRTFFESRVLRFFGRYSYGLYMWHPLVGGLLARAGLRQRIVVDAVGSGDVGVFITIVVKLAVSTLVALASYRLIEAPFLRLKDGFSSRGRGPQGGAPAV